MPNMTRNEIASLANQLEVLTDAKPGFVSTAQNQRGLRLIRGLLDRPTLKADQELFLRNGGRLLKYYVTEGKNDPHLLKLFNLSIQMVEHGMDASRAIKRAKVVHNQALEQV